MSMFVTWSHSSFIPCEEVLTALTDYVMVPLPPIGARPLTLTPTLPIFKAKANSVNTAMAQSSIVSLILPYLYLGPSSATSATSTFIAKHDITHIISVGRNPESTLDNVTYLRLSIEDSTYADLRKPSEEAVAFIDKARALRQPCKLFVHCFAGVSRSPAIVAFYLMHSCDMSLKSALGLIVRARPNACPNSGFVAQLQQAELELRGSSSLPLNLIELPSSKEARLALLREDGPDEVSQELCVSTSI